MSDIQVAILAGGKAMRLGRLTANHPKSLVMVQGKPFLEYQLAMLRRSGIIEVVLCLGHLGEQVAGYFGDGRMQGLNIRYSFEDTPLGTAGALRNAAELLNDTFFCMYGDSYVFLDFAAAWRFFQSREKLALMTVYENHNRFDRSNATIQRELVSRYDKRGQVGGMTYIDYGVSIFRKEALDMVPPGQPYPLEDLFSHLIEKQELLAFEVRERFYEIGSTGGLRDFAEYVGRAG